MDLGRWKHSSQEGESEHTSSQGRRASLDFEPKLNLRRSREQCKREREGPQNEGPGASRCHSALFQPHEMDLRVRWIAESQTMDSR